MSNQLLRLDGDTLTINLTGWMSHSGSEVIQEAKTLLEKIQGRGYMKVYGRMTCAMSAVIAAWAVRKEISLSLFAAQDNNYVVVVAHPGDGLEIGQTFPGYPTDSNGEVILPV